MEPWPAVPQVLEIGDVIQQVPETGIMATREVKGRDPFSLIIAGQVARAGANAQSGTTYQFDFAAL
jgi:hypothetical protein